MTTFNDREKDFENKFKHDQELEFRVTARRNKLLGLWAAGLLGIHGHDAEAYAKKIIASDLERPGDQDVVDRILADFTAKGVAMSDHRLRKQMEELHALARAQIKAEA